MSKELVGQNTNAWAVYHGIVELSEAKNHKPTAVFRHYKEAMWFGHKKYFSNYTVASIYSETFK